METGAAIDRPESPPRRLRACVPCTRAKARCNFQDENMERHLCDRCQRMGIVCEAKTTKGLRKPRQIKPLVSRVASLEQKIEGLSSLFSDPSSAAGPSSGSSVAGPSTQPPPPHHPSSHRGSTTSSASEHLQPPASSSHHPPLSLRTPDSLEGNASECGPLQPSAHAHAHAHTQGLHLGMSDLSFHPPHHQQHRTDIEIDPAVALPPPYGFTWAQVAAVFNEFKLKFLPNFPYVVFENPEVTAYEVFRDKPFLFRAILFVASPLPEVRQQKMKKLLMKYLAEHLMVEEERSLDLLQGMLVAIAWGDFGFFYDQQMTNLTYLAMGYAHNLGITKIPFPMLQALGKAEGVDDIRSSRMASIMTKAHSLEEQRAYLGVFYIMAVNSVQFGRKNPFRGRYVDMCCETLDWSLGAVTDFMAEKTIRLVQMAEKIADTFGSPYDVERGRSFVYLVEGQARALRMELDKIAESVGHQHPQFSHFWMQYNYILVRLYEPATFLTDDPETRASLYRSQCLFHCLHACNTYFKTFCAMPPDTFLYRSFASIEQIQFVTIIATRLLLLECDGWDLEVARMTLDFVPMMDRIIEVLSRVDDEARRRVRHFAEEMGLPLSEAEMNYAGVWAKYVNKIKTIKTWYEGRLAAEAMAAATAEDPPQEEDETGAEALMTGTDANAGPQPQVSQPFDWSEFVDPAAGNPPLWVMGLLGNSAWDFDNV